ncbi:MAG: D-glycerate dehydrogenase [Myxococcales bacterium]|nr:D-glycerate dehydrogenase [Myxococcales bacterium]
MAPPKMFVARELPVDAAARAGQGIDVRVFSEARAASREEILQEARGAAALVTTLSQRVDGDLLDALPTLRVVSNYAVGYDNIDVPACTARGIWVGHTPDVLTDATADLAMALLLAVARRLPEGEAMVRAGDFGGPWHPRKLLGMDLSGATLGIVGMGRIGRAVAHRAKAFGMRILHSSRSSGLPLPELLAQADAVSLHCPLTEETHHLFDASRFAEMKRGSILINTARGPIVDEGALVAALEGGVLRGAGLDVYEREPAVHPGLVDRRDVVLLPHVGSATEGARRGMAERAIDNAARVLRGEEPLSAVNRPRP